MTTLDFPSRYASATPVIHAHSAQTRLTRYGVAMVQLHDELWRVTRTSGEVLGYIESFPEGGDQRYRAKRMFPARATAAARPSMSLGEFWSIDDAVDCFRFS